MKTIKFKNKYNDLIEINHVTNFRLNETVFKGNVISGDFKNVLEGETFFNFEKVKDIQIIEESEEKYFIVNVQQDHEQNWKNIYTKVSIIKLKQTIETILKENININITKL
jgi:hypothetical protein